MLKNLYFAAVTLVLAACGHAEAEPQPAPEVIERLAQPAESADPKAAAQEKLEKAGRIAGVVDRTDPDRLAGAAERLLAR
ncbi:MAG TPA: hypothetical protein VHM92_09305 [Allosphingosinicella sp.]|nr:hypothetical protein [Allosphingosinicella sp.]